MLPLPASALWQHGSDAAEGAILWAVVRAVLIAMIVCARPRPSRRLAAGEKCCFGARARTVVRPPLPMLVLLSHRRDTDDWKCSVTCIVACCCVGMPSCLVPAWHCDKDAGMARPALKRLRAGVPLPPPVSALCPPEDVVAVKV